MTMLKVRLKALKNNPYSFFPGCKKGKKSRSRTERAVCGNQTFRERPENIIDAISEIRCLEVKKLVESDNEQINQINKQINQIKKKVRHERKLIAID